VPLSTVLDAHGLGGLRPYAFATSAVAAFVSPLLFGAMADRRYAPVLVLRWLAVATAVAMALAATAIRLGWPPLVILACIQLHAIFSSPTWSLASTIVLARLADAKRQFGPLRAMATLGWMAGCWVVSAADADASTLAGYGGSLVWLGVAWFSRYLPSVTPVAAAGRLTLRQRFGLDALALLRVREHRVVFVSAALFAMPLAAFYACTPPHLRELGLRHTSGWMTLGQVTEMGAMFALAALLATWRFKVIFAAGLVAGLVRYVLCAMDGVGWVLAGVFLHGLAFTLCFITAQIYLDQQVEPAWRARAQALMTMLNSGVGNLVGYLGSGWWLEYCRRPDGTRWSLFWGGLAVPILLVIVYFLGSYRERPVRSGDVTTSA